MNFHVLNWSYIGCIYILRARTLKCGSIRAIFTVSRPS